MPSSSVSPSSTRSGATSTSPTSRTSINSPATSTSTSTSTDKNLEPLPWILHHILESHATCELPTSIMFAINSGLGQNIPRLKEIYSWWQLDDQGKLVLAFLSSQDRITPSIADATVADIRAPALAAAEPDFDPLHCPDDRFMDRGNEELLKIGFAHLLGNAAKQEIDFDPQNRKALPAHFVRKYCLDRVFVSDFKDVNFDHALTALDYLRDLEYTRRTALRQAALGLGINEHTWRRVLWGNVPALKWVEETQGNELRIELMYSDLFLDLRIWTMTSVLLANDFNKAAALAMLNTLFPPAVQDLPNPRINPRVLLEQRAIFYRYTLSVEQNDIGIVIDFKEKLSQPDNRHQWPMVRGTLERYTNLAEKMIQQASEATDMLRFRVSEPLDSPKPARGFTATSFEAFDNPRTAPKTPKAKTSLNDMRAKFGLNKKPSQVFGGQKETVYSKSMVNVSRLQKDALTHLPVEVRGRNPEPRKPEPRSSPVEVRGRNPETGGPEARNLGLSRTTPTTSQPTFDNLLSIRPRGLSKPMGFVPPPLDEVDRMVGCDLMHSPWNDPDEEDDVETPGSTPKVSFDFDSALGLRSGPDSPTFSSPPFSTDAHAHVRSKQSKPNLLIDTESATSKQPALSPSLQSARAFLKYREPTTPTDTRPQTADNPNMGRRGLRPRGSSKKLYSGFDTRQTERFPSLATLPIQRREITEPAMIPEPLNINRPPRKPSTPVTSNLSSFPPRNNFNRDQDSPAQTVATKSITFADSPNILNSPSQEYDESLAVKKAPSNVFANASRPSTSSEASLRPIQTTSTVSSSASRRLPSDNLDFLSRPYTSSSSDMEFLSPVIRKNTSLSSFFNGRKASTPALADEFSRGDGLGIFTESSRAADENGATNKQVKKKSSLSALIHGKSKQKEKSGDHDQLMATIAQGPGETASVRNPVVKKKSSVGAFIYGLSNKKKETEGSDQRADSMSQKPDESPRVPGILKNEACTSAFKDDNPANIAGTQEKNEVPTQTPTSAKSARFDDILTTSPSHNSAGSEKNDNTQEGAKLKSKKSYNFINRLRSSDSKATLRQKRDVDPNAIEWFSRKPNFSFSPPGLHYSSVTTPPQASEDLATSSTRSEPRLRSRFASSTVYRAPEPADPLLEEDVVEGAGGSQALKKKKSMWGFGKRGGG
ncbi:uncharacterized protein RCO7_08399 [Rhynchosporium graminicola]|uniref:Uncharacterized protein n=1 Tax=Rhynchosporium graminicola TaxID=2792576 RepID=A0A1E1KQA1_9HELO|nr:uncharacterized protein RCO7_08399 [Rhynchosporium commune]